MTTAVLPLQRAATLRDGTPAQRGEEGSSETQAPTQRRPRPFAVFSRAWGFHLEVLASAAAAGTVAVAGRQSPVVPLTVVAVWLVVNFHQGRTLTSPLPAQLRRVAASVSLPLALVATAVGFSSVSSTALPPAVVAVVSGAGVSALFRAVRWRLQSPVRVVLVGDRVAIAQAAARWSGPGRIEPVGALLMEPDLDAPDVPAEIMGVPTVAGLQGAASLAARLRADVVIVSPGPGFTSTDFRRLSWTLEGSQVSLGVLGVLDSVAPHRITSGVMSGATVLDVRRPRPSTFSRVTKAALDRLAGALLLVVAAPVIGLMVLAVRLDSKGPGLYRQTRVGRDGRPFTVFKLRTMVRDADAIKAELEQANEFDCVLFKMRRDPRVTRVGRLLRRTSLDELPQLINVVRGEMSLVGPRPNLPTEVAQMDDDALRRLAVRPGITGLWQVSGRSDLGWEQASALDTYYADNWSLPGDASILLRTVKAVLGARGAY